MWTVPDAITVHGSGGSLRVGYQVAAVLGAWTVTTWPTGAEEARRCRVEADLVTVDPFWSQEAEAFTLTLSRGNWVWRWAAVPVRPTNGRLIVDGLPPPDRR